MSKKLLYRDIKRLRNKQPAEYTPIKEQKDITPLRAFNKFLEYVDTPTKMHLMTFGDEKGLKEYRVLRTQIETTLKRLEQIEINQTIFENNPITVGKKLKALEIIKDKKVNVRAFLKSCYYKDIDTQLNVYNSQCNDKEIMESKELTKEEYELLKEILK